MIERVDQLISRGQLDAAWELLDQFNTHQELWGIILKSRIKEVQGDYQEAYTLAAEALALSLDQGRRLEELGSRVALSYALVRQFRLDECRDQLKQANQLLELIPSTYYTEIKRQEATIYNIAGLSYWIEGKLEQALAAYQRSYEIRDKLNIKHEIASSKTNIGMIHQLMGNLELAEQYHQEARQSFEELENNHLLAYSLHSLGGIYWEQDQLDLAMKHYEQALSIRIHLDNHHNTAHTLFHLILLNLEFDYPDHGRFYFDILKELNEENHTTEIGHLFLIAKAMLLKTSNRLINRAESQQILEDLEDKVHSSDLLVIIYLNLCDLYLADLKLSQNDEIIKDVEKVIAKLHELAKRQLSTILRIETLLIRAKLFLVKLDLEMAQQILFQAELMANKHGLNNLAFRISAEHDNLIDKLYQWDKLQRRNASLIERMKEANFTELIDSMRTKRQSPVIRRELERPHFLLVMNQDALTLYSAQFDPEIIINRELIGSFLVASDMGMAVALNETGSIERIKYGDYTLIFIHHDKLVFCYGYEGQSYFAIRRLQDFINRIRLSRSWDLLRADVPRPKVIEENLADKVQDYFAPDGIYSQQHKNQR